jgi:hypothetical protein
MLEAVRHGHFSEFGGNEVVGHPAQDRNVIDQLPIQVARKFL